MRQRHRKEQLLRSVPWFRGCTRTDLTEACRLTDVVMIESGRTLFEAGKPAQHAYVVVSGDVASEGRPLNAGDHIGTAELLSGGVYTSTAVTRTDTVVLAIGRRELRGLIDRLPAVRHAVLVDLAQQVVEDQTRAHGRPALRLLPA